MDYKQIASQLINLNQTQDEYRNTINYAGQVVLDKLHSRMKYCEIAKRVGVNGSDVSRAVNHAQCSPELYLKLAKLLDEVERLEGQG